MTRVKKLKKAAVQGVRDYAGMFKKFHEAWKGRKESYDTYVKTYGPKK